MELDLPLDAAQNYSSSSQRIRVLSESWVNKSIYCPNCGSTLTRFGNNAPVADFYCENCSEEYELKSAGGNLGTKITDGAYGTMVERLRSNNNPNLLFLTYDKTSYRVRNFLAIPKYFFVEDLIEKRKPLSQTARRAGWTGCNIMMGGIPNFGKIFYIQGGEPRQKTEVLASWSQTVFVKSAHDIEAKGWLLDILNCVERIKKLEFKLEEVYRFESYLKTRHPLNNNIQAKIRQQLQYLRDQNVLEFVGNGVYRMKV